MCRFSLTQTTTKAPSAFEKTTLKSKRTCTDVKLYSRSITAVLTRSLCITQ